MLCVCPYCGFDLWEKLVDGVASCVKCGRVFDSSLLCRLLSASWLVRKNNYHGIEQLISDTKLAEHEAILVYAYIQDNLYSHDEFFKILKLIGIDQNIK